MTTQTNWAVDPQHSVLNFKVKHLAIANVSGVFKVFHGTAQTGAADFDGAAIHLEIDTKSIDTNNAERDGHLTSPLFLNAEKFPVITISGSMRKTGSDYHLDGDLTLLGVTKKIRMDVEPTGVGKGRFNEVRAGFEVAGKINRKDFGLNFSLLNEAGDLVVGHDIKLQCDIELIQQNN